MVIRQAGLPAGSLLQAAQDDKSGITLSEVEV